VLPNLLYKSTDVSDFSYSLDSITLRGRVPSELSVSLVSVAGNPKINQYTVTADDKLPLIILY
jgi:hypothetical protein